MTKSNIKMGIANASNKYCRCGAYSMARLSWHATSCPKRRQAQTRKAGKVV